jgi:hypothetical protein
MMDADIVVMSDWLLSFPDFERRFVSTVRHAVSYALYPIGEELQDIGKAEKTIIGIKWEQFFRREFDIPPGENLDCSLLIPWRSRGIEFDCKLTVGNQWMIPPELIRIEGLCLVCQYSEAQHIRAGVLRVKEEYLNMAGSNRDRKRILNQHGREAIDWILEESNSPHMIRPLQAIIGG